MPRISQLTALTTPANDDSLAIVDASASTTKKITRNDFLKGAPLPSNTVTTAAVSDGAITPDKRTGGISFGILPTNTTGSKTVELGFKPQLVKFRAALNDSAASNAWAVGWYDGTNQGAQSGASRGSNHWSRTYSNSSLAFVTLATSGGTETQVTMVGSSFNNTGFTINVTGASSVATVYYEAFA